MHMKLVKITKTETNEVRYFATWNGAAKYVGKSTPRLQLILGKQSKPLEDYKIELTEDPDILNKDIYK